MQIPFTFPLDQENYLTIQNIPQLKTELTKQKETPWISVKDYKIQKRNRDKYIYAKCKNCKAKITYKWDQNQQIYKLTRFENRHNHEYQQRQNEEVIRFINDLPFDIQLATARKIAVSKFNITPSKFYHMFSRIKRTNTTFQQLIRQLEDKNHQISLDPFPLEDGSIPTILVLITPEMKSLFEQFGQTVCYDLTYNLIQEISPQRRQYAVGIFTGVNCYNKIIPFGISITCQQTTEAFTKIFQTFIETQGSPKAFITDEQIGMISALNRLKNNDVFKGNHLFDSFHVIRNFGKMTERKQLMTSLAELIKQQSHTAFQVKLQDLKRTVKTQSELKGFQLFLDKIKNVCFSQIPSNSFVIFNSSNSINEKMNDLIKRRIRIQKKYSEVLRILVSFCENIIITSNNAPQLYDFRIEELFDDNCLKLCRFMLAKRPMKQFLSQYVASMSLKQPFVRGDQFTFNDKYSDYQCMTNLKEFSCSCNFYEKTGIPCRHIILICRQNNINYLEVIHKRWKFESKQIPKNRTKIKRSTRRRK